MDEISLKALAKINLGLDVLGKREDGYHDVRMIMQTIHLYDRVEIKKTKSPAIRVEIICTIFRSMRIIWCIVQQN